MIKLKHFGEWNLGLRDDDVGEHGHLVGLTSLVLIFNIAEGLMEKGYISGSLRVSLCDN